MATQHILRGVTARATAPKIIPSFASGTTGRWLASRAVVDGSDVLSVPNSVDPGSGDFVSTSVNKAQLVSHRGSPALLFGSNNYLDSSLAIPTESYSRVLHIEFSDSDLRQIWGSDSNAAGEYQLLNKTSSGQIRLYHQGALRVTSSGTVSSNTPISLVQTCRVEEGAATINMFANGTNILSDAVTIPNTDTGVTRLGFFTTSANGLTGYVWDAQLVGKVLTQAEIDTISDYHANKLV